MALLTLDGLPAAPLARRWAVPRVVLFVRHASSLDAAHELAGQGAPDATAVLAEEQTAGRGRDGRSWHSPAGGVWLAMVLRPTHAELAAASIRAGLVVADVVDELLGAPSCRLKWPNDVLVDDRKIAGVLCEGRWQGDELLWLAVGVGINVCNPLPDTLTPRALSLRERLPSIRRLDVLDRLVPALARLTAASARLTDAERAAFGGRDWLAGRALRSPVAGRGAGLGADGALLVAASDGAAAPTAVRDGHVELA
jgi:BirA family biotin operon repressor/biotin-[acetyl-CoA-carboxylase] ligase